MDNELNIRRDKVESALAEREANWEKKLQEVRGYKDGAGNEMDEGILETVIALNLLDISTIQSCAGHIERGMMPWVQIQQPNRPKGIYKKSDVTPEFEEWQKKQELLKEKTEQLLEEYNNSSEHKEGLRLRLNISFSIGVTNDWLDNINERNERDNRLDLALSKDESDRLKKLIPLAQEEMQRFGAFVKDKYFKN